jgi:hypothetical protein
MVMCDGCASQGPSAQLGAALLLTFGLVPEIGCVPFVAAGAWGEAAEFENAPGADCAAGVRGKAAEFEDALGADCAAGAT